MYKHFLKTFVKKFNQIFLQKTAITFKWLYIVVYIYHSNALINDKGMIFIYIRLIIIYLYIISYSIPEPNNYLMGNKLRREPHPFNLLTRVI